MVRPTQNIFDLHCDTLTECQKRGIGLINSQLDISLDRLPRNIRLCQCMAIFMPDEYRGKAAEDYFDAVLKVFREQLVIHQELVEEVVCTSKIAGILKRKQFAFMLTVEGGSALAGKLENVWKLHDAGVKMMTLTWNGANEICGGAATTEGFTQFGRSAVAEMERLGMVVDVSHLSDKGFYQLCDFAEKPFVASHSNSRTICNHRRNLTDDMFKIICQRGGIVGLNYFEEFILEGGGSKTVDDLMRHVHHFLDLGGEHALALGSDYDGAAIPGYIKGVEKQEYMADALIKSGIAEKTVQDILYDNAGCFFAGI